MHISDLRFGLGMLLTLGEMEETQQDELECFLRPDKEGTVKWTQFLKEACEPLVFVMARFNFTKVIWVIIRYFSTAEQVKFQFLSTKFYEKLVPNFIPVVPVNFLKVMVDRMLSSEPIGITNQALLTWNRIGPMSIGKFKQH